MELGKAFLDTLPLRRTRSLPHMKQVVYSGSPSCLSPCSEIRCRRREDVVFSALWMSDARRKLTAEDNQKECKGGAVSHSTLEDSARDESPCDQMRRTGEEEGEETGTVLAPASPQPWSLPDSSSRVPCEARYHGTAHSSDVYEGICSSFPILFVDTCRRSDGGDGHRSGKSGEGCHPPTLAADVERREKEEEEGHISDAPSPVVVRILSDASFCVEDLEENAPIEERMEMPDASGRIPFHPCTNHDAEGNAARRDAAQGSASHEPLQGTEWVGERGKTVENENEKGISAHGVHNGMDKEEERVAKEAEKTMGKREEDRPLVVYLPFVLESFQREAWPLMSLSTFSASSPVSSHLSPTATSLSSVPPTDVSPQDTFGPKQASMEEQTGANTSVHTTTATSTCTSTTTSWVKDKKRLWAFAWRSCDSFIPAGVKEFIKNEVPELLAAASSSPTLFSSPFSSYLGFSSSTPWSRRDKRFPGRHSGGSGAGNGVYDSSGNNMTSGLRGGGNIKKNSLSDFKKKGKVGGGGVSLIMGGSKGEERTGLHKEGGSALPAGKGTSHLPFPSLSLRILGKSDGPEGRSASRGSHADEQLNEGNNPSPRVNLAFQGSPGEEKPDDSGRQRHSTESLSSPDSVTTYVELKKDVDNNTHAEIHCEEKTKRTSTSFSGGSGFHVNDFHLGMKKWGESHAASAIPLSQSRHPRGLFGALREKQLHQMVVAVLNKVSEDKDKFRKARIELMNLPVPEAAPDELNRVLQAFLRKAIAEPQFSHLYAKLMQYLCHRAPISGSSSLIHPTSTGDHYPPTFTSVISNNLSPSTPSSSSLLCSPASHPSSSGCPPDGQSCGGMTCTLSGSSNRSSLSSTEISTSTTSAMINSNMNATVHHTPSHSQTHGSLSNGGSSFPADSCPIEGVKGNLSSSPSSLLSPSSSPTLPYVTNVEQKMLESKIGAGGEGVSAGERGGGGGVGNAALSSPTSSSTTSSLTERVGRGIVRLCLETFQSLLTCTDDGGSGGGLGETDGCPSVGSSSASVLPPSASVSGGGGDSDGDGGETGPPLLSVSPTLPPGSSSSASSPSVANLHSPSPSSPSAASVISSSHGDQHNGKGGNSSNAVIHVPSMDVEKNKIMRDQLCGTVRFLIELRSISFIGDEDIANVLWMCCTGRTPVELRRGGDTDISQNNNTGTCSSNTSNSSSSMMNSPSTTTTTGRTSAWTSPSSACGGSDGVVEAVEDSHHKTSFSPHTPSTCTCSSKRTPVLLPTNSYVPTEAQMSALLTLLGSSSWSSPFFSSEIWNKTFLPYMGSWLSYWQEHYPLSRVRFLLISPAQKIKQKWNEVLLERGLVESSVKAKKEEELERELQRTPLPLPLPPSQCSSSLPSPSVCAVPASNAFNTSSKSPKPLPTGPLWMTPPLPPCTSSSLSPPAPAHSLLASSPPACSSPTDSSMKKEYDATAMAPGHTLTDEDADGKISLPPHTSYNNPLRGSSVALTSGFSSTATNMSQSHRKASSTTGTLIIPTASDAPPPPPLSPPLPLSCSLHSMHELASLIPHRHDDLPLLMKNCQEHIWDLPGVVESLFASWAGEVPCGCVDCCYGRTARRSTSDREEAPHGPSPSCSSSTPPTSSTRGGEVEGGEGGAAKILQFVYHWVRRGLQVVRESWARECTGTLLYCVLEEAKRRGMEHVVNREVLADEVRRAMKAQFEEKTYEYLPRFFVFFATIVLSDTMEEVMDANWLNDGLEWLVEMRTREGSSSDEEEEEEDSNDKDDTADAESGEEVLAKRMKNASQSKEKESKTCLTSFLTPKLVRSVGMYLVEVGEVYHLFRSSWQRKRAHSWTNHSHIPSDTACHSPSGGRCSSSSGMSMATAMTTNCGSRWMNNNTNNSNNNNNNNNNNILCGGDKMMDGGKTVRDASNPDENPSEYLQDGGDIEHVFAVNTKAEEHRLGEGGDKNQGNIWIKMDQTLTAHPSTLFPTLLVRARFRPLLTLLIVGANALHNLGRPSSLHSDTSNLHHLHCNGTRAHNNSNINEPHEIKGSSENIHHSDNTMMMPMMRMNKDYPDGMPRACGSLLYKQDWKRRMFWAMLSSPSSLPPFSFLERWTMTPNWTFLPSSVTPSPALPFLSDAAPFTPPFATWIQALWMSFSASVRASLTHLFLECKVFDTLLQCCNDRCQNEDGEVEKEKNIHFPSMEGAGGGMLPTSALLPMGQTEFATSLRCHAPTLMTGTQDIFRSACGELERRTEAFTLMGHSEMPRGTGSDEMGREGEEGDGIECSTSLASEALSGYLVAGCVLSRWNAPRNCQATPSPCIYSSSTMTSTTSNSGTLPVINGSGGEHPSSLSSASFSSSSSSPPLPFSPPFPSLSTSPILLSILHFLSSTLHSAVDQFTADRRGCERDIIQEIRLMLTAIALFGTNCNVLISPSLSIPPSSSSCADVSSAVGELTFSPKGSLYPIVTSSAIPSTTTTGATPPPSSSLWWFSTTFSSLFSMITANCSEIFHELCTMEVISVETWSWWKKGIMTRGEIGKERGRNCSPPGMTESASRQDTTLLDSHSLQSPFLSSSREQRFNPTTFSNLSLPASELPHGSLISPYVQGGRQPFHPYPHPLSLPPLPPPTLSCTGPSTCASHAEGGQFLVSPHNPASDHSPTPMPEDCDVSMGHHHHPSSGKRPVMPSFTTEAPRELYGGNRRVGPNPLTSGNPCPTPFLPLSYHNHSALNMEEEMRGTGFLYSNSSHNNTSSLVTDNTNTSATNHSNNKSKDANFAMDQTVSTSVPSGGTPDGGWSANPLQAPLLVHHQQHHQEPPLHSFSVPPPAVQPSSGPVSSDWHYYSHQSHTSHFNPNEWRGGSSSTLNPRRGASSSSSSSRTTKSTGTSPPHSWDIHTAAATAPPFVPSVPQGFLPFGMNNPPALMSAGGSDMDDNSNSGGSGLKPWKGVRRGRGSSHSPPNQYHPSKNSSVSTHRVDDRDRRHFYSRSRGARC